MDLICPSCRGSLQLTPANGAVCPLHGGRYEVLFDRFATTAPALVPTDQKCDAHPAQPAIADCATCGKHLCALCSFELHGANYCSDCGVTNATISSSGMLNLNPIVIPRQRHVVEGMCADHPEVQAVAFCRLCGKRVCATCDFAMPGDVHLCPACVENQSSSDVSPKRKKLSWIALALASWSTLLFVMLIAGAFNSFFTADEAGKAADLVITNLILWPLLVGVGVSLAALDSKLKNTGLMKVAAWWNGVLGGIFLLIVILANLGIIK